MSRPLIAGPGNLNSLFVQTPNCFQGGSLPHPGQPA